MTTNNSINNKCDTISTDETVSMLGHIFGAHVDRIGLVRTLAGGLSMYLCIPLLVMLHVTVAVPLYQWFIRPLFGIPRVQWSDHVFIDRSRIKGLTWFDKFNCDFCAYANGLTTLMNLELDHLASWRGELAWYKKATVICVCAPIMLPAYLMGELGMLIIYDTLVSRPLGMHRVSYREAALVLRRDGYASQLWLPLRTGLLAFKNTILRFSMALEQIESSWCPLRHFETRNGVVYPDHHEKFFGHDELLKMHLALKADGTVSPRKPLY